MIPLSLGEQVENVMDVTSNDYYYIDWLKWVGFENEHNILIICNSNMHANIVSSSYIQIRVPYGVESCKMMGINQC
jgi:hypothetical protein